MVNLPQLKKTRLAPTPSGFLHLGNIYSFAITVALAKETGAKIFLRIDDADRERTNKIYVQDIFDTLNFLEIPYDEGPRNMQDYETEYSQVHRMTMYNEVLNKLKEDGKLFACTCTRTQVVVQGEDSVYPGTCRHKNIPFDAPNVSWRIIDDDRNIEVKTLGGAIVQAKLPANMRNFIVRKKDGFPAYQVTSVIDDMYFGVDLIVRGEDLWGSTLAQLYLSSMTDRAGFADTTFYHHPLILDGEGHKLSKSAGATSVHYLRQAGKSPAEIYAHIAAMLNIHTPVKTWQDLTVLIAITPKLPG